MPGLILKFLVATIAFVFVMITWEYFVFLRLAYFNATYTPSNATTSSLLMALLSL